MNFRSRYIFAYKDDILIGKFSSIPEAVTSLLLPNDRNISSCTLGKRKTAYGYKWKWEYIDFIPLDGEQWAYIPKFKGLYAASTLGRIASCQFHGIEDFRIMTQSISKRNYKFVKIRDWKNQYEKSYVVHRLVAETFIPNIENKPYIDHIDTNLLNNNVNNLRWVTSLENQNNPITLQRLQNSITAYNKSEQHKIDTIKALGKPVNQYNTEGILINSFPSISQASSILGIPIVGIWRACNTKTIYRNFIFKYLKDEKV